VKIALKIRLEDLVPASKDHFSRFFPYKASAYSEVSFLCGRESFLKDDGSPVFIVFLICFKP